VDVQNTLFLAGIDEEKRIDRMEQQSKSPWLVSSNVSA
jgi:hypothetical protein